MARHILKQLNANAITGDATMSGICRGAVQFDALDRQDTKTRMRLRATVISVKPAGEVVYELGGKLHRVRAGAVVLANGSWTSKHIAQDLPSVCREAYAQFHRAPLPDGEYRGT